MILGSDYNIFLESIKIQFCWLIYPYSDWCAQPASMFRQMDEIPVSYNKLITNTCMCPTLHVDWNGTMSNTHHWCIQEKEKFYLTPSTIGDCLLHPSPIKPGILPFKILKIV